MADSSDTLDDLTELEKYEKYEMEKLEEYMRGIDVPTKAETYSSLEESEAASYHSAIAMQKVEQEQQEHISEALDENGNIQPADTGDKVINAVVKDALKNKTNTRAWTEYHLDLIAYTGREFSRRFVYSPRYDKNGMPDTVYNNAQYRRILRVGALSLAAKTAQNAFICEMLLQFDKLDYIDHTKDELTDEQRERIEHDVEEISFNLFGEELDNLIARMEYERAHDGVSEYILYREQLERINALKETLPKAGRLNHNPLTTLAHDNYSKALLDMSQSQGRELLEQGFTTLYCPIKRGDKVLNEGEHLELRVAENYKMPKQPSQVDRRILRACGDILDDPLYSKDRAYSLKQIAERMPLSTRDTASSKSGSFNLMELEERLDMWRNVTAEGVIIDSKQRKLEFKRDSDERMLNATKVYINDAPHYYIYSVALNKIASCKGWMQQVPRSLFSGSFDAASVEESLMQQIIASRGKNNVKPSLTYETLCKQTGYPLDLDTLKAKHQKEKIFNQAESFLNKAVADGEFIAWYKVTTKTGTRNPLKTGWTWGTSLEDKPEGALDADDVAISKARKASKNKAKNIKAAKKKTQEQ